MSGLSRPGEKPLDRWSLAHLAAGTGLGLLHLDWWLALAVILGYEALEGGLRWMRGHGGKALFEHESWANIAADIVVGMAGWWVVWAAGPFGWVPKVPWA